MLVARGIMGLGSSALIIGSSFFTATTTMADRFEALGAYRVAQTQARMLGPMVGLAFVWLPTGIGKDAPLSMQVAMPSPHSLPASELRVGMESWMVGRQVMVWQHPVCFFQGLRVAVLLSMMHMAAADQLINADFSVVLSDDRVLAMYNYWKQEVYIASSDVRGRRNNRVVMMFPNTEPMRVNTLSTSYKLVYYPYVTRRGELGVPQVAGSPVSYEVQYCPSGSCTTGKQNHDLQGVRPS